MKADNINFGMQAPLHQSSHVQWYFYDKTQSPKMPALYLAPPSPSAKMPILSSAITVFQLHGLKPPERHCMDNKVMHLGPRNLKANYSLGGAELGDSEIWGC